MVVITVETTLFENDVKTYGTQAFSVSMMLNIAFENDVKTYGTQAVTEAIEGFS